MRQTVSFIVSAVLCCSLLAAEDELEILDSNQGFKLRRPSAAWKVNGFLPPAGTRHALKLVHTGVEPEVSFTLFISDFEGADAALARKLTLRALQANPNCSGFEHSEVQLGERTVPVLSCEYKAAVAFKSRQLFFVAHDSAYTLQCLAGAEQFKLQAEQFEQLLASFSIVPLKDEAAHARELKLRRLARRCGKELDWASGWTEAAARAHQHKKLVLVVVENYQGFNFPKAAPASTFMEEDLVELMRERFVPLQWDSRMDAPFEDPALYGMGPHTFGRGVLFVTPEGKVVGEGVTLEPFYLHKRACEVLAQNPGYTGEPVAAPDVAAWLRRGEWDKAQQQLTAPKSPAEWRQQAALFRQQRRGEEALHALEQAGTAPDLTLDRGVLRMRLGQAQQAELLMRDFVQENPEHERLAEARYWLCCLRAMRQGFRAIREELSELALTQPESRWGWRAAAILQGGGLASGVERLAWPSEAFLESLEQKPAEPLQAQQVARAQQEALRFLLKAQLENGAWASAASQHLRPTDRDVAIAAICGRSLLPHRQEPGIQKAIDKALSYVLTAVIPARLTTAGFDSTAWRLIYSVSFLSRCLESGVGQREQVTAGLRKLVEQMQQQQRPTGGWAYTRGPGGRDEMSNGFVTAAAVCALNEAKTTGTEVPAALLEKALAALQSLRAPDGSLRYFDHTRAPGQREAESSLRGPLYALALWRLGKATPEAIEKAFAVYLKHREHVRKERGKVLCHTGPEGHASYYLLFNYVYAAEALRALPVEEQARYRGALLEDVLFLRTSDGAFCDNPVFGRSYGAGMALEALRLLAQERAE